jgi:hypothetical protein
MMRVITSEIMMNSKPLLQMDRILPSVYNCELIYLPKVKDDRGNLTFVENSKHLPFDVNRVFYLYDIPGGENRGAHAHYSCHQFLVAVCGSFEVILFDGSIMRQVQLNRPYMGLHIPPGVWAEEVNFSSGAVCLVLASHSYDAIDYIRDKDEFIKYRNV